VALLFGLEARPELPSHLHEVLLGKRQTTALAHVALRLYYVV